MDLKILQQQKAYFLSGKTQFYEFRIEQLRKLKDAILKFEKEIAGALHADLRKSEAESYVTETGLVLSELKFAIRKLKGWMKPDKVSTNLVNLPSGSYIISEPKGNVLLIGPWNYPFQLNFNTLIGAIGGGNCVVLKPSEQAPATAAIIEKMIKETYTPEYIYCVNGEGKDIIPQLMNAVTFDHIFFTGSTAVGRKIYEGAAKQLIPVTLELGGKSPAVVAADAKVETAARRIAFSKCSNAGQMCVAPDYAVVHEKVYGKFIDGYKAAVHQFFGDNIQSSTEFSRIVNEHHFERLIGLLEGTKIIYGGKHDKADLFIEPTMIEVNNLDHQIMTEEIFGPILPVFRYNEKEEAKALIMKNKNPLAFYVFSESKEIQDYFVTQIPFGGGCINSTALHLTNHHLPFGGRGNSGIGNYHGKYSFDTFTHKKAILKTSAWPDPAIKYPPFNKNLPLLKKIIG